MDGHELLLREQRACLVDPMTMVNLNVLRIKDKKGNLSLFAPNEVQKKVLQKIRELRLAKKPIRLCVLKGRQFGISTLFESILYAFTSQRANINSLIMADDDDGANYLFEMTKLFHEEMEKENSHLIPKRRISNEKKMEFHNKRSQILIDTAKNVDAGRKYTFRMAHLSECSRFRDLEQSLISLLQSVPKQPETYVFLETTANGENAFCLFWRRIVEEAKRDETEWVPIFLSWKDHLEYQRGFVTESEKKHFIDTMTKDEKDVMTHHDLSLEQMHWRRNTIQNDCLGNVRKFVVEYPLTAEEAFATTGFRVFPDAVLRPHEKNICEPKFVGDIAMVDSQPQFIDLEGGHLKIFKPPQQGHRYAMASDSSDGFTNADASCIQVIDRSTWEQVAVLHGNIPPDVLGTKMFALGAWYKWALAAPEVNASGLVTTLRLRDLNYPRIVHYTRLNIDDSGNMAESDELGWHTNQKTKPLIIAELAEVLRDLMLVVHDAGTMLELKAYSVIETKESGYTIMGAARGLHDDRVMSLAIAVHFAKTLPEFDVRNGTRFSSSMPSRNGHTTGYG